MIYYTEFERRYPEIDSLRADGYFYNKSNEIIQISEEEKAEVMQLELDARPLFLLREGRNFRLKETDWWASSDLTMTATQTAYRKALRDLPSTASPSLDENGELTGVVWPTKPE
jgi:hypothetical protein